MKTKQPYLTKEELYTTKKLSITEGSFTSTTAGFGEQYITPYALKLGATSSEIAFLSSFPVLLGSIFQLLGAKLADNTGNRKKIVVLFVALQALMLLPLFVVPLITKSIYLLIIIFSAYMIFGNIASPPWNSWMGDLIPDNERIAYFSKRNKITTIALLTSVICSGIILSFFSETNIWIGFGILFSVALIGRSIAAYLFTKHYETLYVADKKQKLSLKGFVTHLNKTNFGNFVLLRSAISFSVLVSSPFFAVFMLNYLKFSYLEFSIVILSPMITKILTFNLWAKYTKKYGTKAILTITGFLIALIPLLWFFWSQATTTKLLIFIGIVAIEAMSGLAWGGFELSTFNYMLENTASELRAKLFSYYTVFFGVAVFIGGISGGLLINYIEINFTTLNPILTVFLVSFVLRLLSVLFFSPKLKEVKIHKKVDEKRIFYEIFIARPIGFAVHTTMQRVLILEKKIEHYSDPIPRILKRGNLKRKVNTYIIKKIRKK